MHTKTLLGLVACGLAVVVPVGFDVARSTIAQAADSDTFPDFDGDGNADLVVTAERETINGIPNVGAVTVFYGGDEAPGQHGSFMVFQDAAGVHGVSDQNDFFGRAWDAGDFNGDGHLDLVVGVNERSVKVNGGAIQVFWGSANGLTKQGNRLIDQDSPGVPDTVEAGDGFGADLAAGDFDGDGDSDLAVAAPGERANGVAGGAVFVFDGAAGSDLVFDRIVRQGLGGIPGQPEADDLFGAGIVAGNFDGGVYADLAIGASGEDIGAVTDSGWLVVVEGSASGLAPGQSTEIRPGLDGVPGQAEAGATFGAHLGAGELHADGRDELLVCSGETTPNPNVSGALYVLRGSPNGPTATGGERITPSSAGIDIGVTSGDLFCYVDDPVIGDIDGNGRGDVVIRVWRSPFDGGSAVFFGQNASDPLLRKRMMRITQSTPGVFGVDEPSDGFGSVPRVLDFDGDGDGDLVLGVPGEDIGATQNTGDIWMHEGPLTTINANDQRRIHQDSPGIPGVAETDDYWGR